MFLFRDSISIRCCLLYVSLLLFGTLFTAIIFSFSRCTCFFLGTTYLFGVVYFMFHLHFKDTSDFSFLVLILAQSTISIGQWKKIPFERHLEPTKSKITGSLLIKTMQNSYQKKTAILLDSSNDTTSLVINLPTLLQILDTP